MAKYSSLTKEQKEQISKYKDSPNKRPREIAKEINLPPEQSSKQISGYLHFLRRNTLNIGRKPKQTQAKPQQTAAIKPEQINPSQNKPEKPEQPNKPEVPRPKKEEVKQMAIEQNDLGKIQQMIDDTTTAVQQQTIELTKQSAKDAASHALTNFKETEKREKEKRDAEAKQQQAQVQISGFCKEFPDLCKRVDLLEKKVKGPEKPEEPEGAKKEVHSTAKEYLECPECSSALVRAMAKMTKTIPDFAKKIQESLKTQGITLELVKGGESEHEEEKPKEGAEGLF